ncbi:MAG: hypothetical protein LWY06_19060 [Firmicutes bacterium]|nr:hypothetical protein [Bacillota bacterium]
MDSIRFNSVNTTPALPAPSNRIETAPQAPPPQGDSVNIGGAFKNAIKLTGATIMGLGMGTGIGIANGVKEAHNSALKSMGLEGPAQTKGQAVQKALVYLGSFAGIAACAPLGFPGLLVGVVAGPGMVGGMIQAGKGAVEGAKTGINVARNAGNKAEAAVAGKLGGLAGKAAKLATTVATGLVTTPVLALVNTAAESLKFAFNTIGVNPQAQDGKEKLSNVAKIGATVIPYLDGLVEGGGLIEGGLAGAAVAGGMATTVKGAIGAGKGFMAGFKEGFSSIK